MRRREIFIIYASGLSELAFAALGFAVCCLIGMQILATLTGSYIDANGVLVFSWQIILLMALWPGQTFWTIRRRTAGGQEHSIIGVPSDDDLCLRSKGGSGKFSKRRSGR